MPVAGDCFQMMFKGESQQTAGQPGQFAIEQLRMARRVLMQLAEHRFSAVQRVEQPEQGNIRHGKISHPRIAFTTHGHQASASGLQAM